MARWFEQPLKFGRFPMSFIKILPGAIVEAWFDPRPFPCESSRVEATPILEVQRLTRTYQTATEPLTVLQDISFALAAGDACAIIGPSGSGKTTLLGLCAGLDLPSTGTVRVNGMDLGQLDEDGRARVRNEHVGFVFQNFQLLPTLTALENVMVPLELRGTNHIAPEAKELLRLVGLGERLHHYPVQLSGGEQQRVALARAFINRPKLLFADEPTGNLDTETGHQIIEALFQLNRERGTTLVLVTHDQELAERAGRVVRLKGGALISDSHKP
jgi:putative ABC transport system ATP-binding protein